MTSLFQRTHGGGWQATPEAQTTGDTNAQPLQRNHTGARRDRRDAIIPASVAREVPRPTHGVQAGDPASRAGQPSARHAAASAAAGAGGAEAQVARFDGDTFDPARDGARLSGQLARVMALMADGRWRTLAEIAAACGCSEASASARLRDARKSKFGGYRVDRQRVAGARGLWKYRLVTEGTR